MGFVDKIRARFLGRTKQWSPADELFFRSARQNAANTDEKLTEPYSQNAVVLAAVRSKARMLAQARFEIVVGRRDSNEGTAVPSTHPVAELFARPSPFAAGGQLFEQWSTYKDLDGEAFAVMLGKDGWWEPGAGPPKEIVNVDPRAITIRPGDYDKTTGLVLFWTLTGTQGEQHIPAHAVIHPMHLNPRDMTRGLSPLRAVWNAIDAEMKADLYTASMLANDGTPGGILSTEQQLTPEQRRAAREEWNQNHGGPRRARKLAVLEAGTTYQAIGHTARDMEMVNLRSHNRDAIKAAIGVTDFEVGKIADYNRANSQSARAWLWEATLVPELKSYEDVLWSALFRHLSAAGSSDIWGRFRFDEVEALKPALLEAAQTASTFVMAGYDPESVSEKLGLDLEVAESVSAIDFGDSEPTKPAAAAAQVPVAPAKSAPAVRIKAARQSDAVALIAVQSIQERAEAVVAAKVRAVFTDRWDAVRRALRLGSKAAEPPSRERLEKALGSDETWASLMRRSVGDSFVRIGTASIKQAGRELGGFDVVKLDDPAWRALADRRVASLVRVAQQTRVRLAKSIAAALENDEGYSVEKLATEIDRKFGSVVRSNGMVIARTETAMHQNAVRHAAFKAEGVDKKVWRASRDEHTRESHRAMDGEEVALDAPFSNGMMHPGSPGGPAAEVINCRCVERPRYA